MAIAEMKPLLFLSPQSTENFILNQKVTNRKKHGQMTKNVSIINESNLYTMGIFRDVILLCHFGVKIILLGKARQIMLLQRNT